MRDVLAALKVIADHLRILECKIDKLNDRIQVLEDEINCEWLIDTSSDGSGSETQADDVGN